MLRRVVPPPWPEMMLSIVTPAAAKYPFSIATAHGRVAVTRPYWLTAISAADAAPEQQAARAAKTIENAQRPRRIGSSRCCRGIMSCLPGARNRMPLRQFADRGRSPTGCPLRRGKTAPLPRLLGPAAQIVDQALFAQRAARHAGVAAMQDQPMVG